MSNISWEKKNVRFLDSFTRNMGLSFGMSVSVILLIRSIVVYKLKPKKRNKQVVVLNLLITICWLVAWFVQSDLIGIFPFSCSLVVLWLSIGGDDWFDDWRKKRQRKSRRKSRGKKLSYSGSQSTIFSVD